jgi:hypothetical protein
MNDILIPPMGAIDIPVVTGVPKLLCLVGGIFGVLPALKRWRGLKSVIGVIGLYRQYTLPIF